MVFIFASIFSTQCSLLNQLIKMHYLLLGDDEMLVDCAVAVRSLISGKTKVHFYNNRMINENRWFSVHMAL